MVPVYNVVPVVMVNVDIVCVVCDAVSKLTKKKAPEHLFSQNSDQ